MPLSITDSHVRSLFISDVHLGSQACHPLQLQHILSLSCPRNLYLVGDFCDGWLLRRQWQWPTEYRKLLATISELSHAGTRVHYILGNHDRCLQRWIRDWGAYWIGERCVHHCLDGRRLLVIHGDQFDATQSRFRRTATLSAIVHERILGGSCTANRWLNRMGLPQQQIASAIATPFRNIAHSLSQFGARAERMAKEQQCSGVVCGHTHAPRLRERDGFLYANTGDWLENCSAIIETMQGQLELWTGLDRGVKRGASGVFGKRIKMSASSQQQTSLQYIDWHDDHLSGNDYRLSKVE